MVIVEKYQIEFDTIFLFLASPDRGRLYRRLILSVFFFLFFCLKTNSKFVSRFTDYEIRIKNFCLFIIFFCACVRASVRACVHVSVRASVCAFFWHQNVWVYCLCLELCMIHQNGMQFLSTTNSRIFINRKASNFFSFFKSGEVFLVCLL